MNRTLVDDLYMSAYPAFAMLAGIQLDLFTALAKSPATAEELAMRMQVMVDRLTPLLNALVVTRLLRLDDRHYANGPEADAYLVQGRPEYLEGIGDLFLDRWHAALGAAQSIRQNSPSAKKDFAGMTPEQTARFFGGMFQRAVNAGRDLAQGIDLSRCSELVDAGGGSGGFAIGLCQSIPSLKAVVADLPPVLPTARRKITEAGLIDRISVVECDLVAGKLPGKYDVAIARSLFQVLSPPEAQRALATISSTVRPGGAVYAIGRILDDSELAPHESVFFNLVFISLYTHGRAYPEWQYRQWFEAAGLVGIERTALAGGVSVMAARKPG